MHRDDSRRTRSAVRDADALLIASEMLRRPTFVHMARRAPLPEGMSLLLEVAAGDGNALAHASDITGEPPARLREAAGFFAEQILFADRVDHYRVLGTTATASAVELRHHMALLMRWLHPDTAHSRRDGQLDRSVFAARVTSAWQVLKSPERRGAYDATLRAVKAEPPPRRPLVRKAAALRRTPGLILYRQARIGLFERLLRLLQGGR